jgi:nicotinamidase-related amidase
MPLDRTHKSEAAEHRTGNQYLRPVSISACERKFRRRGNRNAEFRTQRRVDVGSQCGIAYRVAPIHELVLLRAWHFLRDTPGFAIVPELQPLPSEAIFDKLAMSAFEGTPLAFALRDCGITAIAVAGIAMEIGIEPTVRHAADLGFVPVVITDACGAGHADAAKRSLESLAFAGDAFFTDTETFCRLIRRIV